MKEKRFLVTGGAGDLGKVLAPRIAAVGASMRSLDLVPSDGESVESITGSILDRSLVNELVAQTDIVVHIAAWHGYHAFTGSKTAEEFWDLNMTGTFNLLEACARHQKRKFIFISSTSVDEWPELYGTTKLLGEGLCRAYANRHSMQILSLRPRAFIPWWNTKVYRSKRDWAAWFARGGVHIDDVATSVMLAYNKIRDLKSPFFEVVEIDGKHDFDADDTKEWRRQGTKLFLTKRFPALSQTILGATFLPEEPPTYKDISKARTLLGYTPSYGYEEMLREIAQPPLALVSLRDSEGPRPRGPVAQGT